MRAKRAQTATEYLIILAVVIVIALIVVGVMGGIPGVGKSGKKGADEAYWSTATIGLASVGISASGADTYVLKNNDKDTVIVNSVTFNGAAMLSSPRTLAAGESATISPGDVINGAACPAGNSFSFPVVIIYQNQVTMASYNVSGHNVAGTCAN